MNDILKAQMDVINEGVKDAFVEKEEGLLKELYSLKKRMFDITGEWDGEEAGLKEERAAVAEDVIEAVDNLLDLIHEL